MKQNTVELCRRPELTKVEEWRFKKDVYDPPKGELGLPAHRYLLLPALHAFTMSGQPTHVHDFRFRISLNMN